MRIFGLVLTHSTIMIIIWSILLIIFIIFRWNKSSKKEKTSVILLFLLALLIFIPAISRDNSLYLLNGFKADTIVLEYEDTTVSVPIDEIFEGKYGIISDKESFVSRIKKLWKAPYLTISFFDDDKLFLKVKGFKSEEESNYIGEIDNIPIQIKWNGYKLKYNDVFYENIEKVFKTKKLKNYLDEINKIDRHRIKAIDLIVLKDNVIQKSYFDEEESYILLDILKEIDLLENISSSNIINSKDDYQYIIKNSVETSDKIYEVKLSINKSTYDVRIDEIIIDLNNDEKTEFTQYYKSNNKTKELLEKLLK